MEQIVRQVLPDLAPRVDSDSIQLPGAAGLSQNPLRLYPQILGRTLKSRKSYVHGDLHLRNMLVDRSGRAWPVDFAKAEERHNLFDFITLETRVRMTELARDDCAFSLSEYLQFEHALNDVTLGKSVTPPNDPHLRFAYQVILTIRNIARRYMGPAPDFETEYFPALFLYCLAVTRYYPNEGIQGSRLAFATACVLGQYLLKMNQPTRPAKPGAETKPLPPDDRPAASVRRDTDGAQPSTRLTIGNGRRWAVMIGINAYQDRDISNLNCCVADVQAVHRLLTAPTHGGYQARLLLDTASLLLPTRNNILAELSNVAQATDEKDLILFYFSGHGAVEAGEAYLIPCDARLTNLADTAIPLRRVKEIMAQSKAQAKVILLDACHSGARIGKAEAQMSPEFMQRVFVEAEGLAILASCHQGQVSYEWEQAGQSVFTHYLLEGLVGAADFDHKGFITVQDINRYVADQVKVWAMHRGRSQSPTLGGGRTGDVVMAGYPKVSQKRRPDSKSIVAFVVILACIVVSLASIVAVRTILPLAPSLTATSTSTPTPSPSPTLTPTPAPSPSPTPTPTPSPSPTPTSTPTPTPLPRPIVNTENLTGWLFYSDQSRGNPANNKMSLVPGRTHNAIEISYDLERDGYVIITRHFDPSVLTGTIGLSFFYKGTGVTNTIECKLMLRYPGDTDDTTYGIMWNRASNTDGNWTHMRVLYSDFACLWPVANCQKHGNKLDLTRVDRLDFAISNKPGDQVGSGKGAFDDVLGIQP